MEFGIVAGRGIEKVEALLEVIAEHPTIPSPAKDGLALLGEQIAHLNRQLKEIDQRLTAQHKANAVSSRLAGVPGIGLITALTLALKIDPQQFESGRHTCNHITGFDGRPRFGARSSHVPSLAKDCRPLP